MSHQNHTSFCELRDELKNREIASVIKFCQDFDSFFELKDFYDVTIRIGSQSSIQTFYGHSFILYARSSFFQKILTSDGSKIDNHNVEISDVSPKEFEVLLRYIYNGRISLDNKSPLEIFNLLLAALKLDFEEAVSYLQSNLIKSHHMWLCKNFSLVHKTCQQHRELVALLNYCVEVPKELFMSENFDKIEKQVLVELLGNYDLLEIDVIEIWDRVLKWGLARHPSLNSDPKLWTPEEIKSLTRTLENLLPLIQFHQLTSEQIGSSIQPYRKLFQESIYEDLVKTSHIEYFKVTEEKNVMYFKIPETINNWFQGEHHALSLFICLDTSGSMSGSLRQAKEAILTIMGRLLQRGILVEKDITCFFYGSTCKEVRFSDNPNMLWDNGEIENYFEDVKAGGGTNFDNVFDPIINNLDRVDNDLAIIFLTDGKAQPSVSEQTKNNLEDALLKYPHTTEVHTIGFTQGHDASLLSWLTTCGSKGGNFMYIKESSEIQNILSVILPLLELRDRTLYVKVGDQIPLAEQFDDQGVGTAIFKGKVEGERVTILKHLKSQEKYEFQPPRQISDSSPMAVQSMVYYIQHEVQTFANEIINYQEQNKYERIQQLLEEVERYEEKLDGILQTTSNEILETRNDIIQDAKYTIGEFKIILTKKSDGTLSNEKIAKFNDLIYKNIRELKKPEIFKPPKQDVVDKSDSDDKSVSDDDDTSVSDNTSVSDDDKSVSLLLDKINALEACINQRFDQLQSSVSKTSYHKKEENCQEVTSQEVIGQEVASQEVISQEVISQEVNSQENSMSIEVKKPIRCGSNVAFIHVITGKYLSASKEHKHQRHMVIGHGGEMDNDNDVWTVTEANGKGTNTGYPVHFKTVVRFRHKVTGGYLHSTSINTSKSNLQGVSAKSKKRVTIYLGSNSDDDWTVQLHGSKNDSGNLMDGDIVSLIHNSTHKTALCSQNALSNDGTQEVFCYGHGKGEISKWRVVLID